MANRYWVGGAGTWDTTNTANWSTTSGGAGGASVPTASDNAYFDANSGSGVVVTASGATCSTLTMNSTTASVQLGANMSILVLTLTAGLIDLNDHTLQTQVVSAGSTSARTLAYGASGKIQITRTATVSYAYDLYNATTRCVVTGNHVVEYIGNAIAGVTIGFRGAGGSPDPNPPTLKITNGAFTVNVGSGFVWNTVDFTGFSGTWNTASIDLYGDLILSPTMTSVFISTPLNFLKASGTQTITSNGITINTGITVKSAGVTVDCADALTIGSTRTLTMTAGKLRLKNGVTSTVGTFATSGTTQKFLQSTTAGVQATLSQASGTVNATYLTIQDINATGGATWNAYTTNSNVDGGNNDGWDFSSQLGKYIYTRRKNKRILP